MSNDEIDKIRDLVHCLGDGVSSVLLALNEPLIEEQIYYLLSREREVQILRGKEFWLGLTFLEKRRLNE